MIRFVLIVIMMAIYLGIIGIPCRIIFWVIGLFNMEVRKKAGFRYSMIGLKMIEIVSGVKVTVIGHENIPEGRPVLYIGNHRSFFDIIVTYPRVKGMCGYISKKEITKIPLLWHWMYESRCLLMDRDDMKQQLNTILEAIDKVKNGISMTIFPEGTRNKSDDVDIYPFKAGSFKVALKTGCPIVPMTITGTREVFEDHLPKVIPGNITVEYGKPIYVEELSKDDQKKIQDIVYQQMLETYARNRERR